MKEDLLQRLEEVEDLAIQMDSVHVTIPWKIAKDLLSRAGHLTREERINLQWKFGDAPYKSKRSEKVRLLLERLGDS